MTKHLPVPTDVPVLSDPDPRVGGGETDWRRAYTALVYVHAVGFQSSEDLQQTMDFVRRVAGDEAADLFLDTVNRVRTPWMQNFMG